MRSLRVRFSSPHLVLLTIILFILAALPLVTLKGHGAQMPATASVVNPTFHNAAVVIDDESSPFSFLIGPIPAAPLSALAAPVVPASAPAAPAPAPEQYVVQAGDTLTSIAAAKGLADWTVLYRANLATVTTPDQIAVGLVLVIPNAAMLATLPPAPAPVAVPVAASKAAPAPRPAPVARTAAPSTPAAPSASGSMAAVIARAKLALGRPYVFGAAGPRSFDCSGLVVYAFQAIGMSLPHFTGSLIRMGHRVSYASAQPGDLIFLEGGRHVGIYLGGGTMIVAPHSGSVVKYQSVYQAPTAVVRL